MKYLFLLLFVFGVFGGVFGQDNCVKAQKELENKLDKFNSDYEKAVFLDKLYSDNSTCHYLSTLIFDEANEISKNTKDEKAIIWSDFIIASYLRTHREYKKAIELYEKIISNPVSQEEDIYYQTLLRKNSILITKGKYDKVYKIIYDDKMKEFLSTNKKYEIHFLRNLSKIKFKENKLDSVQVYLDRINILSDNDKLLKAAYYNLVYSFYDKRNMYDSALIILHKEENLRFELKDSLFLSDVYSSLGIMYYHFDDLEASYKFYDKALQIQELFKLKKLAKTYDGIGRVLIVKREYEEAFIFLEKSITEYEKLEDFYNIAFVKELFAYLKAGLRYEAGERVNFVEEIKMGNEAFEYQKEKGTSFDIVASGNNLCMVYLLASQPKEAKKIMVEIKKYEHEVPIEEKINIVLADIQTKMVSKGVKMVDIMSEIGADLGRLRELQDSVAFQKYDKEVPRLMAEAEANRAKLETLQKEKQIVEEQAKQDRILYWSGSGILILLLGSGLGFLFFYQKSKRKTLEERVKSIDEAYGKIKRILHDELSADIGVASNKIEVLSTQDTETQSRIVEDLEKIRERVRNISHEVGHFEDSNLLDSLDEFLPPLENKYLGVDFDFTVLPYKGFLRSIKGEIGYCSFLVIRETVRNAIKYGEPNKINILIELEDNILKTTITDNGKGFDVSKTQKTGLQNLKERVSLLKGKFDIISDPQKGGTKAVASIPYEEENNKN